MNSMNVDLLRSVDQCLGVTPIAADRMLKSARAKLGAVNRNDASRIYSLHLAGLRESNSESVALGSERQLPLIQTAGPIAGSTFTFRDMEKAYPRDQVIAAVRAVSEAVRAESAKRIAAGEQIAYAERDQIIASRPVTRDLATCRRELMDEFSGKHQAASKNSSAS